MPLFLSGKNREPDLRETIRATLKKHSRHKPSEQVVDDIYQIVIHYAADYRFERLEQIVQDWATRQNEMEKGARK